MSSKITIGGQAVIEGVMMRSLNKYAIAVRKPNKKIITKTFKIPKHKSRYFNMPVIRGILRFGETLVIGVKSISYSASESTDDEEALSSKELFFTVIFSIGLTILLFYVAPLLITRFLTQNNNLFFNLLDGLIRLLIFLVYLSAISLMPDIKRVFQYHGAEHKTVYAYENNEKLTVKNVKKYSTLHPRCGTNFILIVFVLSIFFFSLFPTTTFFGRVGIRIVLLPLIAGVSYEFLKFAGNNFDKKWVKISIFPGLLLQKITTKEPDDSMIEVSIAALKAAIA